MIEVLLVDDQKLIRDGIKNIINQIGDIRVVETATDGDEAIELVRQQPFDIVLLDIAMPGKNGLEVLDQVKEIRPEQPVLMLSVFPEDAYAIRSLKLGANGYLTKNSDANDLESAIRKISEGGKYITPELAELLAFKYEVLAEKPKHQYLSNREYDIFCKLAEGKSIKEIAEEYNISDRTVSTYRYRILEKLGMANNADLTRYAIENRLIL